MDKGKKGDAVFVTIEYPKDYKKEKFFAEGAIAEISEETKAQFIELGIVKSK